MSFIVRKFVPAFAALAIVVSTSLAMFPAQQAQAQTCPTTSSRSYDQGGVLQWDLESNGKVRPNYNHPDKTLYMRGHANASGTLGYVDFGATQDVNAPQFATIFNPARVPTFKRNYKIYEWNWGTPPNPGSKKSTFETHDIPSGYSGTNVTMLGVTTSPGEVLRSPTTGYDLGSPWGKGAVVVNADSDHNSITLHFTREDTITEGYSVMIEGVCVDPELQSLYDTLDNSDRNPPASQGYGDGNTPHDSTEDYDLPGLRAGQVFGTAQGAEIRLVMRDKGFWMDPRDKNEWWRIRPATPDRPTLFTPANGSRTNDTTPTFTWGAATSPSAYEIQFSADEDFTTYSAVVFGANRLTYTPGAGDEMDPGIHYWRVRSGPTRPFSAVWSFTIDLVPPGAPTTPITPDNGASVVNKPTLTWTAPAGEAAAAYHVEIDNDSAFGSPLPTPAEQTGTSYSTSSLTMPLDHYYWHVQARDAAGNWGDYSATFEFGRGPGSPTLTSPDNNATRSIASPTFTWEELITTGVGDNYQLQVDTVMPPEAPLICNTTEPNVSRSSCTFPDDGTYKWRVRGFNEDGDPGAWSAVRTLKIDRKPPIVTTIAPDGPGHNTAPDFEWTRPGGAENFATSYVLTVKQGAAVILSDPDVTDVEAGCDADTSCVVPAPWTFIEGTYTFTVTPSNSYGSGPASAARTFTIDITPPPIPANSTPKNNSTNATGKPALTSAKVSGGKRYAFEVLDSLSGVAYTGSSTTGSVTVSPALDYGVYTWRAKAIDAAGNESGWSYPFSLIVSRMIAPKDNPGLTDRTPTFTWSTYNNAPGWRLSYGTDPDPNVNPYVNKGGKATSYTVPGGSALVDGVYYWALRVNDGTWMPTRMFTVGRMIAPKPNAVTTDTTPKFTWGTVSGAATWDLAYIADPDLFDGVNPDPSAGTLKHFSKGTTLTYTIPGSSALADGVYFWALSGDGGSNWMPAWMLTITRMQTPKNGSFTVDTTPTFKWAAVTGATNWDLAYTSDPDGNPTDDTNDTVIHFSSASTRSYTVPGGSSLTRLTRYYWTLRANGGAWMPVWSFVVQ